VTTPDKLHVSACELADAIAAALASLQPEREILPQIDRLRALVADLAEKVDDEGRPRGDAA
jgi:hypothetical protein